MLSLVGLRLVRRYADLPALKANNQVAGFIIGIVGAICAVVLAFMMVTVWNQFHDTQLTIEREANQLEDLSRIAGGFQSPVAGELQQKLRDSGRAVIDDEWAAMAHGEASQRAQIAMDELFQAYRGIEPQTRREKAIYSESLKHLEEMSASRSALLNACRDDIPHVVWVLLLLSGVTTVAFTYFFGTRSALAQSLMTALLAIAVAFILFLIVALDNPFRGDLRVSPDPLKRVLERISAT